MKILKIILVGLLILLLLGIAGFIYLGMQSKTGTAPGLANGQLSECPSSPNCVSSEDGTAEDQTVAPLPAGAWGQLPALVTQMGGKVTSQTEDYISAEFTSSLFGFVDDVEFRQAEDSVQIRSASRVGYSDAGANAARVAALRAQLTGNE